MGSFYSETRERIFLFICEGSKYDKQVVDNIKKEFFPDDKSAKIIFESYNTHIYNLYKEVKKYDFFVNVVEVLKEFDKEKSSCEDSILSLFRKHNISEESQIERIYLFFDYDGQNCTEDGDSKLCEMLEHFNNETDPTCGKLYISYPMCEAFKDRRKSFCIENSFKIFDDRCLTSDCFFSAREKCVDGKPYKKIIGDLYHFSKNGKDSKGELLKTTLRFLYRLNCLFYGDFKKIEKVDYYEITCESLLLKQVEKYITPHDKIFILSAFPHFIVDYFGYDKIIKMLEDNNIGIDDF